MKPATPWHLELDALSDPDQLEPFLERIYTQSCRTTLEPAGFFLISIARIESAQLRASMVSLKIMLSRLHQEARGQALCYLSMGRFDQQITTRFHLDGAPPESLLMLGYEPTAVKSRLLMADYTRCARDLGMTPQQFLDELNPMFSPGEEKLAGYVTELGAFDSERSHIVLINDSRLPVSDPPEGMLGVLHKAEILTPSPDHHRFINSTMIHAAPANAEEQIGEDARQAWIGSGTSAGMANY